MDVSVCAGWRAPELSSLVSFGFLFFPRPAGGGHSHGCQRFSASGGLLWHFVTISPRCDTASHILCVRLSPLLSVWCYGYLCPFFFFFLNCQFGDHVFSELAAVYVHVLLWSRFEACWCRNFIQIQNKNVWKPFKRRAYLVFIADKLGPSRDFEGFSWNRSCLCLNARRDDFYSVWGSPLRGGSALWSAPARC